MNREIKFRGKSTGTTDWHKKEGAWVYGQYMAWYFDAAYKKDNPYTPTIFFIKDGQQHRTPVYPETVGQFTGLLDKDGKEIYEGDIVFINRGDDHDPEARLSTKGFIDFDVELGSYVCDEGHIRRSFPNDWEIDITVVGNIFESGEGEGKA